MIKALLFDVDGVLLDSRQANVVFYRDFLARYGYHGLSEAELAQGHYMTMREAIATLTRAPEPLVSELTAHASRLEDYPSELLTLPSDCAATLASLAERYDLAIVTGRLRAGIDHFFVFSRLEPLFSAAVGYEDYSRPKPDAEPLLVACERLGVRPDEAVYVGDAQVDIECAAAAGVPFVAFGDAIARAPLAISCFAELPAALDTLAS